jgi:tetratricopeptide (TPR) repeat protein
MLMGRSAEERLTRDTAIEACRRQGTAVAVGGSIDRIGRTYVITLEATNCGTGETISREQQEVESKERVLRTLGRMAAAVRIALGESLASIQRFDVPIEQVTTPSLEALRAFTLGQRQRAQGREVESIPLYVRAIELDPDFASAYMGLSTIYSNLGDADRAREYAKKAYERRGRVGERERLSLTYQYHYNVTGDQARAREALEVWRQSFPREFQPVNALALADNFTGRFERAVEEAREAVRRNPAHGFPYSNLAHAYRGLGRFDEARKTAEQAVALRVETLPTRRLLYQMAMAAGDHQAALQQLEWARGRAREFDMTGAQAQAAAWAGRVGEARQLYEKTIRLAEDANLADVGSGYLAYLAWMELAYGDSRQAAADARRVLARNASYDPRLRAALVLAVTGSAAEAEAIVSDLQRSNPEHTFINFVLAPIARAGVEMGRNRPRQAIEHLRVALPYETGQVAALAPIYLRARCYLMIHSGPEAAAEFQKVLDHRGSDPFSAFHAVARLGLARARTMTGNGAGARESYEAFLSQWSQADPDLPVLVEARREYRHQAGPAAGSLLREFTPAR